MWNAGILPASEKTAGRMPAFRGKYMSVTIVIPTPLRQFAGGNSEIEVEAATAGDALQQLTDTHGELRKHLYNEQDKLRNFINVYVGDEDIRHLDGPATPVKDGETIMIVPSIAGGSTTVGGACKRRAADADQRRIRAIFAAPDPAGGRARGPKKA